MIKLVLYACMWADGIQIFDLLIDNDQDKSKLLVPTSSCERMLEKIRQNIQHIDGFLTVIRQLSVLVYRVNKVAWGPLKSAK